MCGYIRTFIRARSLNKSKHPIYLAEGLMFALTHYNTLYVK